MLRRTCRDRESNGVTFSIRKTVRGLGRCEFIIQGDGIALSERCMRLNCIFPVWGSSINLVAFEWAYMTWQLTPSYLSGSFPFSASLLIHQSPYRSISLLDNDEHMAAARSLVRISDALLMIIVRGESLL